MWIAIAAGYLAASTVLYASLVYTSGEIQDNACADCKRSSCDNCPYNRESDNSELVKAA